MKLYPAKTTAKEYAGCKNVAFNWFRDAMPQGHRDAHLARLTSDNDVSARAD
jgi:hypothetical protein